jgi:DNA-binding PadR family transcriptional regulator
MAFDVRTLCLGILSIGEATGYEIKKALEEGPFGHVLEASFGAIYPALGRLTEEGLGAPVDARTGPLPLRVPVPPLVCPSSAGAAPRQAYRCAP